MIHRIRKKGPTEEHVWVQTRWHAIENRHNSGVKIGEAKLLSVKADPQGTDETPQHRDESAAFSDLPLYS